MENIKSFIGNVMTTSHHQRSDVQNDTSNKKFPISTTLTSASIQSSSAEATIAEPLVVRNRSNSECSNQSDVSIMSDVSITTSANYQGNGLKNLQRKDSKDSEPYFWIMWHS